MNYQMFRLSLVRNVKPPILEYLDLSSRLDRSRKDFLVDEFSKRVDFIHWGRTFSYVNIGLVNDVIVARVGRRGKERVSDTPENKFAPIEKEEFQAVNVFIDPASDPNGQKLAMQMDTRIGKPLPILDSLVDALNTRLADAEYQIALHPITQEEDFWGVVGRYKGEITSVTFQLTAPNVLGLGSKISEEMANARDENNASEATISLSNKNGLVLDTQDIRDTVQYTSLGGGEAVLRAKRKILFDSRKKTSKIFTDVDVPASLERRSALAMMIAKIFGK